MRFAPLIALMMLSGCRNENVHDASSTFRLEPTAIEFGTLVIGQHVDQAVTLNNDGRSSIEITVGDLAAPYTFSGPTHLVAGANEAVITFTPLAEGVFNATLTFSVNGTRAATLFIHGSARKVSCLASDACHLSTLSTETGTCLESLAPNGTACGDENSCISQGQCVAGVCRGQPLDCDDGNHCTTDACAPGMGCTHIALECPGQGACLLGSCDPSVGCTLTPAEDGLSCGPEHSCTQAQVCVSGVCTERHPPEGFVCGEASPCQGIGRCVADQCVRSAPIALSATWDFDGRSSVDGGIDEAWSDVMLTPTDDVVLSSYFISAPLIGANRVAPISVNAASRRCIIWNDALVCADAPAGGVTAYDLKGGNALWSYANALTDVPQLTEPGLDTFLARLVVLSPTRLGVLFESRTTSADGADTGCRRFSYIVLNQFGRPLASHFITDAIFNRCEHPHSFGVASDVAGNVYLSFEFSGTSNPARPSTAGCQYDVCSVTMSLAPTATVRWRYANVGFGELGIANGELHFSRGAKDFVGEPHQFSYSAVPFGYGVISNGISVMPRDGVIWSEPWGDDFSSMVVASEVHAATWATSAGSKQIVTAIVEVPTTRLVGLDVKTGAQLFQCELADLDHVATYEIGARGMVTMSQTTRLNTDTCPVCDPRFSQTRNRFQWFSLPTLSAGRSSWNGPYGGPAHSHQERHP